MCHQSRVVLADAERTCCISGARRFVFPPRSLVLPRGRLYSCFSVVPSVKWLTQGGEGRVEP